MTTKLGQANPANYQQQLDDKEKATKEQFSDFWQGDIEVHPSPPSHYRMRAEFKMWQQGAEAFYAMYQPGEYKKPVTLEWEFSVGAEKIVELMPKLLEIVNTSELLRKRLFQVEFLTTTISLKWPKCDCMLFYSWRRFFWYQIYAPSTLRSQFMNI